MAHLPVFLDHTKLSRLISCDQFYCLLKLPGKAKSLCKSPTSLCLTPTILHWSLPTCTFASSQRILSSCPSARLTVNSVCCTPFFSSLDLEVYGGSLWSLEFLWCRLMFWQRIPDLIFPLTFHTLVESPWQRWSATDLGTSEDIGHPGISPSFHKELFPGAKRWAWMGTQML